MLLLYTQTADPIGNEIQDNLVFTQGGFGQGLYWLAKEHMPADIAPDFVEALKTSIIFMDMVQFLDGTYISLRETDRPTSNFYDLDPEIDEKGNVKFKGESKLRRLIFITQSHERGTHFSPYASLPSHSVSRIADYIFIQAPKNRNKQLQLESYVSDIAHETAHAYYFIKNKISAAVDVKDAIKKGIDDEVATRRVEEAVLEQIRVAGRLPPVAENQTERQATDAKEGGSKRADVERSLISVPPSVTYLEHFYLEYYLKKVRKDTDNETLPKIRKKIEKMKIEPLRLYPRADIFDYGESLDFRSYLQPSPADFDADLSKNPDYALLYYTRRVFSYDWKEFKALNLSGKIYFDQKEEIVLRHLRFLEELEAVTYTPRDDDG